MTSKLSKIMLVAKTELQIIERLKAGLLFALAYYLLLMFFLVAKTPDYPSVLLNHSPIFFTFLTYSICGLVFTAKRFNKQSNINSLESLLTTPLSISQVIFGKSAGVILFSSMAGLIANMVLIPVYIHKTSLFPINFLWLAPVSIIYCSLFFLFFGNLTMMLQIFVGESEGAVISSYAYVGIGVAILFIMDKYQAHIFSLSIIFTCVILILMAGQYYIFNKILSKEILLKE